MDAIKQYFTDIANAIRYKKGTSEPIPARFFSTEIRNLVAGEGGSGKPGFGILAVSWDHEGYPTVYELYGVPLIPADFFRFSVNQLNRRVMKITLDQGVKEIGRDAFYGNTALLTVEMPGVETIGTYAFRDSGIVEITIPKTIVSVGSSSSQAFWGTNNLTNIIFEDGLTVIPANTLYGARAVETVVIPDSVKEIGASAFYDTRNLQGVSIRGVELVGNSAFRESGLSEVFFPKTIVSVGSSASPAFLNTPNLTRAEFEEGTISIPTQVLRGASALKEVVIPNSVTEIGMSAFQDCTSLLQVTLPESLTYMAPYTFRNCSSLQAMVIPNGITEVPDYFMSGATALSSVILPSGTTRIGENAFASTALTEIFIPKTVTTMGSATYPVFDKVTSLKKAVFEEGMTHVPSFALRGSGVTDVTIPHTVTAMGENVFRDCSALRTLALPPNLTTVGDNLFNGCSLLDGVVLPNTLTAIPHYMFADNTSLTGISLPEGITQIGNNAFRNCTSLTSIHIPGTVSTVGISSYPSFQGCTRLETASIGAGRTSVPDHLFRNIPALKEVTLPSSVSEIRPYSFAYCPELVSVKGSKNITTIRGYAFRDCFKLKTLELGALSNPVTLLEANAFSGCTALTNLTIYTADGNPLSGAPWGATNATITYKQANGVVIDPENAIYPAELFSLFQGAVTKSIVDTTGLVEGFTSALQLAGSAHGTTIQWEHTFTAETETLIRLAYTAHTESTSYDWAAIYVDNVLVRDKIGGVVNMSDFAHTVPPGSHTIKITYRKDGSGTQGYDGIRLYFMELIDTATLP